MILLIDNYDSFVYNLYQYIGTINNDVKVFRNDKISIEEIDLSISVFSFFNNLPTIGLFFSKTEI